MSVARAGTLLALLLLATVPGTASADEDPVEVRIGEDREAKAEYVALSLRGPSDGAAAVSGDGDASGEYVAVAALGDASAIVAASGTGSAAGLLAATGSGHATGLVAASALGDAQAQLVPLSLAGECNRRECVQASLSSGTSAYYAAYSHPHQSSAEYVAGSTKGPAYCDAMVCAAASLQDRATAPVAVSGYDRAEGERVAASGFGGSDASDVAASGTGDADGRVAVSATGHADGAVEVSGCEAVRDVDGATPAEVPSFVGSRACADGSADLLP